MRNHSRRDRCSSGGSNSFPDNLKDLVHSCISVEPRKSNAAEDSDENHVNPTVDLTDLWVHKPQYHTGNNNNNNNGAEENSKSPKKSSGSGKSGSENWERARKKVLSGRKEDEDGLEAPRVVSSIVKRWKDFEAEKKTPQPANSSSTCSTRTNSATTLIPESVEILPAPASSVACDESSDGTDTPTNDDSSCVDWESDRRVMSAPPSIRGRDSDATESERVRVIDIIKKLTSSGGEESHDREHSASAAALSESVPPLPRVKTSAAEHGCFCPLVPSPRKIRGRRAFNDLLMQMERERVRELEGLSGRKAVSKFQQKGRIQAMLKLKLLRRETEVKDSAPTNCMSPQSIKLTQSSIMHLREKFKTDSKPTCSSKEAAAASDSHSPETCRPGIPTCKRKKDTKEKEKKEKKENGSTTSKQLQEENHHPRREAATELQSSQCKDIIKSDNQIKVCQNCQQTDSNVSPNQISKKPSKTERLQVVIPKLTEPAETTKPSGCSKSEETGKEQRNSVEWTNNDWEENDWGWIRDFSQHTHNGWDQLRLHFQPHLHQQDCQKRVCCNEEASQEWINDVSRPRSEWEDLRQARYQEMLDPYFNNDLQELLQRKSVSNFLLGGLRNKIDQLMISRSQKQPPTEDHEIEKQVTDSKGEKVAEEGVESGGGNGRKTYQEEDEYGDGNDSTHTWSNNQECDMRDEYDQMPSTTLPQFQPSTFFTQENEMKLIHGLMGHMEQLHQEMSEIRRAIINCIDMQVKLQNSIKDEVVTAFNQLGKKDNVKSPSGDECKSKRNCIMCHEKLVNALLYRCGHMITCYKCAQELQWGEGKCPICQAPIVDVVRACVDA
ncbi:uncharacterized protein LOC116033654 [Ipomoea triloba]|uniref:uncharacterized protein LOC116033654 n=1 Tax=Ipomoea triloba TaxID=35885 RepID=UPI00125E152A|nr:uncharacterized protein LOC116033654 [Ipomoea triloba]